MAYHTGTSHETYAPLADQEGTSRVVRRGMGSPSLVIREGVYLLRPLSQQVRTTIPPGELGIPSALPLINQEGLD